MITKIVELTKTKGFYGTKMLVSSCSYNGFTLHVNRNAIMKNRSLLVQINYEYINNPINEYGFCSKKSEYLVDIEIVSK